MKEHEHEHEYEYSQGLAKRSSGPDMLNLQRLSDQIYIYIYNKEIEVKNQIACLF